MPTVTGAHHVAFTVQDGEASAAWYQDPFGMQLLLQADDENVRVRVLVHPDSELIIGLREYPGHDDGAFSEFRTGLDHIAFAVSSREELEAWQDVLAEKGTSFSPIVGITDRHAGRAARPGPTAFVEAVADALVGLGHQPGRIRTERFGPTGG